MEELLLRGGGTEATLWFLAPEVPGAAKALDREWRAAEAKVVGPGVAAQTKFSAMEREVNELRQLLIGFAELRSQSLKWSNLEGDIELELARGARGNVTATMMIGTRRASRWSATTTFEVENLPALRSVSP